MYEKYRNIKLSAILKIEFAENPKDRVRKVVSRSNARVTGKYPCLTNGRIMQWESHLELDAFRVLDADHFVENISEQSACITYLYNGEVKRHYPDLLIVRDTKKIFCEIKTNEEALEDDVVNRTALLKRELKIYGYEYYLLTENEIRQEPRLSNARFLLRHGRVKLSPLDKEQVRKLFNKEERVYWKDVIDGKFGSIDMMKVCRLVLEGFIALSNNDRFEKNPLLEINGSKLQ